MFICMLIGSDISNLNTSTTQQLADMVTEGHFTGDRGTLLTLSFNILMKYCFFETKEKKSVSQHGTKLLDSKSQIVAHVMHHLVPTGHTTINTTRDMQIEQGRSEKSG